MRVWWIPQIPMELFYVEVDTVQEGVKVMDILARYDQFQYGNNIKPDYYNVGGLQIFDISDTSDSQYGSWVDWWDEETGEDDPRKFCEEQS